MILFCIDNLFHWPGFCIKEIIHIVVVLLFTESRGQRHRYNININIQVSFEIHYSVCNIYYVHILIEGKRHCSAERRGPGAAGVCSFTDSLCGL